MSIKLTSSAFTPNGQIPREYTCEGEDVSPALAWAGVPAEAKSLVLIVDDPDAPDPRAPKVVWVHWVLYNIPVAVTQLERGASRHLPKGVLEGTNDWKRTGYNGPCPPVGRHRYFHKLYALDTVLPDLKHPTKKKLEQAMEGHIIATGQLVGTYQKTSAQSFSQSSGITSVPPTLFPDAAAPPRSARVRRRPPTI